jgi:hypothetical protein
MTKVINLKITKCSECPYLNKVLSAYDGFCNKFQMVILDETIISPDCKLPQDRLEYETEVMNSVLKEINEKFPESLTTYSIDTDYDNPKWKTFCFEYSYCDNNKEFQKFLGDKITYLHSLKIFNFYFDHRE